MDEPYSQLSTGISALDKILLNVIPGDNIVFQVDATDDYNPFARAFALNLVGKQKKVTYFRFGAHPEILSAIEGVETHYIKLDDGFESATTEIHKIIEKAGRGSSFVFDCLSEITVHWYSDLMLGNFYMLTCPLVYYMNSIAYFAIIRNRHSHPVMASIRETAQVILDVSRYEGTLYVHPLKAWQRYSPTMYLPHKWENSDFLPVTDSATISNVVSAKTGHGMHSASRVVDVWYRTFMYAQEILEETEKNEKPGKDTEQIFQKLIRMMISRDERIIKLVSKYFSLKDLIQIKERLIGTGLIGGKSVGMLLARAILDNNDNSYWNNLLEIHDSFYVGSDVFYTFIVMNGCWWVRKKQRDQDTFLEDIEVAQKMIYNGVFPQFIKEQFIEMLDYFGQSPIIIRSSSLLEDNYGNAFSGKYESIFCINQGTPSERLEAFLNAVKRVYASSMSADALLYRADRGLLERDEQMGLLIQRVSGSIYHNMFLPQIAGVGYSFNPYSWNEKIDPNAGVIRLVCGLGTRAVNRSDDDYTRVVALNEPALRPEVNFSEMKQFAQKRIDLLDLSENVFTSKMFDDIIDNMHDFPLDIIATKEEYLIKEQKKEYWIITFEKLLSETDFVENMRKMLSKLQKEYQNPVDIEFTVNFKKDGSYKINLLQCRTLQAAKKVCNIRLKDKPSKENIIFEVYGAIIGQSMTINVDRIIYVVPSVYGSMTERERYSVAKLVGRIVHFEKNENKSIMLLGPGRWGTSMPFLGVPVKFSEINTVSVIGEIVEMNKNLVPDVSLGTHYFNDIVEKNILYLILYSNVEKNIFNKNLLDNTKNKLPELYPDENRMSEAVKVIDSADIGKNVNIILNADTFQQKAVCFLDKLFD